MGHSVHAEVRGLRPGREYFYRFKAGDEVSPVGRTRTADSDWDSPNRFLFAFASCQQWQNGFYTAYRHMATEGLDLVVHLGDYIYEGNITDPGPRGTLPPEQARPEPITLEQYRYRYSVYKSDPNLQAAHAAFPWLVTWDDHEVENNYADEISQVDTEPDQDRNVFLPFGRLAEFNVMDTRQYRSDQACGDGTDINCVERLDPQRTLPGNEQERWLLDGLRRSRSRWNVLAQQVVFSQRDFQAGPEQALSMDSWDGYTASRNRVRDGMMARGVENVVVITGDVHVNYAIDIKADFDNPNSRTIGSEFVGTSIATGGDGSDTTTGGQTVLAENPHVKFFNAQRGYVRCQLNNRQWRTDYRVLPRISTPEEAISTRASFVVESGRPGMQPA